MLKRIKLQNYRNYKTLDIELTRANVFFGDNAQGKTNILEAVHLLSSTKSFRSKDVYLIRHEKNHFTLEGLFENSSEVKSTNTPETESLRIVEEKTNKRVKKTVQKNGVTISVRSVLGEFASVIFSPDDVAFFSESPSKRRRYLDIVLCQSSKKYVDDLLNYKKVLDQRNALLKGIREHRHSESELSVWNEKLVEHGLNIIKKRIEYLEFVNDHIESYYEKLSNKKENIEVRYDNNILNEVDFFEELENKKRQDIASGVTNVGPHRDDITFAKNGRDMAPYGSRGEYRTLVLALKFSEGEYLEKILNRKVVYLLDDVFSELDHNRRELIFSLIDENQYIITTTDKEHIPEKYLDRVKIFKVEEGRAKEIEPRSKD